MYGEEDGIFMVGIGDMISKSIHKTKLFMIPIANDLSTEVVDNYAEYSNIVAVRVVAHWLPTVPSVLEKPLGTLLESD